MSDDREPIHQHVFLFVSGMRACERRNTNKIINLLTETISCQPIFGR